MDANSGDVSLCKMFMWTDNLNDLLLVCQHRNETFHAFQTLWLDCLLLI